MEDEDYHVPVLLREVLNNLNRSSNYEGWFIDATLGDGGHALAVLRRGGKVLGIDVDKDALKRSKDRFESLGIDKNSYKLVNGNFGQLKKIISQTKLERIRFKGILLDLGVSSLQLGDSERGFSFLRNSKLDMRMDLNLGVTALDLVNGLNKGELNELFYKLGEEKYSKDLADAVVSARKIKPLEKTLELAGLAEEVYKRKGLRKEKLRVHPATKIFQALRIAVNDELNALRDLLKEVLDVLDRKGNVLIISFHSLEDRIVKEAFIEFENEEIGKIITKKPVIPTEGEVNTNIRSRSAKLRVIEKI